MCHKNVKKIKAKKVKVVVCHNCGKCHRCPDKVMKRRAVHEAKKLRGTCMLANGRSLIRFASYKLCKNCFDDRENFKDEEDGESDNEKVEKKGGENW